MSEIQSLSGGSALPQQAYSNGSIPASAGTARSSEPPVSASAEAQWSLKDIYWQGQAAKIITQNENGPCSLIALCNILLLQQRIHITPPDRPIVTYSYLSGLLAEYLLTQPNDQGIDLDAALSILPRTQYGLDVDVQFGAHDGFANSNKAGELALFQLCRVPLVHGWLADPADPTTYDALLQAGSYNRATELIVRADEIAKGAVVQDRGLNELSQRIQAMSLSKTYAKRNADAQPQSADSAGLDPLNWSEQEANQVNNALVIQQFLHSTSTQLTYHGLFVLAQALQPGQLVALFRNSHLSVLYRRLANEGDADAPSLFTLVTDSSFLMEDEIVWESLVDVDGASSEFYDAKFRKAKLRDGDYVGSRNLASASPGAAAGQPNEDADYALAMQIYEREQARAARANARRQDRGRGSRSAGDGRWGPPPASSRPQPPAVPHEVFTTMRYNPDASPLQDPDALVYALLPSALQSRYDELHHQPETNDSGAPTTQPSAGPAPAPAPAPTPSTNPFLSTTEPASTTTNPFLAHTTPAPMPAPVGTDGVVSSHRLSKHIPLLEAHLKRLSVSAEAMCRIFPRDWSLSTLQSRQALDASKLLESIESALSRDTAPGVRGIRLAVRRDGSPSISLRSVDALTAPSVRLDIVPTRVRTSDLEPVILNKTDERGAYDAAVARVSASPPTRDVLLWNDEDGLPQLTESSIAALVVGVDGRWITPPTQAGLLDGLLRRWMIDHHLVEETPIHPSILQRADAEIWLVNALRGAWTVSVDHAPPPPAPAPAQAQQKKTRGKFAALIGNENRRSTASASAPAAVEQQVHEDLYGSAGSGGQRQGQGKGKGKKSKGDKDKCVVM